MFANGGFPKRMNGGVTSGQAMSPRPSGVVVGARVSYVPSPVYHQGHFYTIVDDGLLCC